ncbi:hypothetical protein [Dyadobacter sp. CY323]|uniref:hypothetical protein n=1 Tax=Dyadobacter sp. CY323 TaxID=2907302 RepID=UPI001F361852|nr:hypothetical protein [Dyadobacter sp. CY323]MCE6987991.1 hypothetical protein [Dyadobacter sp. CY323]
MKKRLFSALTLFCACWLASCSHKTVEKEDVVAEEFDKERFYSQLGTTPFYISKAYRVVGKDTTDLLKDSIMVLYRDAVLLTFWAGSGSAGVGEVKFYGGSVWKNPPFQFPAPPTARAFHTNMKFSRPTSMHFNWDETKKTVVVTSSGPDDVFRMVPPGKSAYLDTSRYHYTYDFEAAKAGVDQSMTWIYEDYTIVMKPCYVFYIDPDSASWERGVVVF